jgi:hypothetical protein
MLPCDDEEGVMFVTWLHGVAFVGAHKPLAKEGVVVMGCVDIYVGHDSANG